MKLLHPHTRTPSGALRLATAIATAGTLSLAASAGADTVSYTDDLQTHTVPHTWNVSLPLFDPSLGTLDSVTLTLDNSIVADIEVENSNAFSVDFTGAYATIPATLTLNSTTLIQTYASTSGVGGTVGAQVGNTQGETSIPGQSASTSGSYAITSDLGSFIGNGDTGSLLSVTSSSGSYGGTAEDVSSGVFFGGSASDTPTVEVTYTYSPVPEPSTWISLAAALGSVVYIRRRVRNDGLTRNS